MLFIHNDVVEKVLDMKDCISAQEEALRQIAEGTAVARQRIDIYAPCDREDGYWRWGTMEGTNGGYFAIRMKSDIMTWPTDAEGNATQEKYCMEPGTFCGLVMLFSTRNGEPLALMNDGVIQHMRVGGAAGVGVKYMAREDAETLCILGSGGMARTYFDAFRCVRDIKRVRVYSPTKANREAFADEMSAKFKIPVEPVATAREAVAGADILASCTDSTEPTFDAAWIEPGMHIANLSSREMSFEAWARVDRLSRKGMLSEMQRNYREANMAHIAGTPEERERLPTKTLEERAYSGFKGEGVELDQILRGLAKGRTSREQVTFFQNSGHQGIQFSSVGAVVYRKAKELGLGREIPTEWFLQDIRD